MKVTLTAKVEAEFSLTEEEVDLLLACSAAHYDSVCRAASNSNGASGIIRSWKNSIELCGVGVIPATATTRDLQTCLKCMEFPNPDEYSWKLQRSLGERFRVMLGRMNIQCDRWRYTFEM